MKDFFKNIFTEALVINERKMLEILNLVNKRSDSTNLEFYSFIQIMANNIDSLKETIKSVSPMTKDDYFADEITAENMKVGICVAVLCKFLYPIIEQIDATSDDGLKTMKEYEKMIEE